MELNKSSEALDAVNKIRERAGIALLSNINMEKIRHERRVETAFEGLRLFDLYRWKELKNAVDRINKEAALAFKTRVALFEGSWQKYHANTDFGTVGADPTKYFKICVEAAEELMKVIIKSVL